VEIRCFGKALRGLRGGESPYNEAQARHDVLTCPASTFVDYPWMLSKQTMWQSLIEAYAQNRAVLEVAIQVTGMDAEELGRLLGSHHLV
jgi:hypothetical protein